MKAPNALSYLATLTDEGLMLEHLHVANGIDSVLAQLEQFQRSHEGVALTAPEADWLKRAHKALEWLQQKRVAVDVLLRNRRLAGRLYPDEFVQAAEESLEDGTFERISSLAANRVLAAREQTESQRRARLMGAVDNLGNR